MSQNYPGDRFKMFLCTVAIVFIINFTMLSVTDYILGEDKPVEKPKVVELGLYTYKATYIKNYDGDTSTFLLDLGFGISYKITGRFYGIDTPEMRGGTVETKAKGKEAKDFVKKYLDGKKVIIKTLKDKKGKYGRYLITIYIEGEEKSLNDLLIEKGLAKEYLK